MNRLVLATALLGTLVATASAQGKKPKAPPPPPVAMPALGEALTVTGTPIWPKQDWLYDVPSAKDAAGKVLVHWFCAPKVKTCADDLARIVTLKEAGKVYVVAHINGSKAQAKKLDPIRESEGVGQGSVAFGKGVTKMMKEMGITGPASLVVDLDGKVVLVSTGAAPADLDARDKKITDLVAAIKDYTTTVSEPPKGVKPGDKFTMSISVKLSSWLTYNKTSPTELKFTVPPDFKCDVKELKGDQLKIENNVLSGAATCTAPRGIYEARGELRFSYEDPNKAAGIGNEGGKWKFEVKP